jgi:hypothetical protein
LQLSAAFQLLFYGWRSKFEALNLDGFCSFSSIEQPIFRTSKFDPQLPSGEPSRTIGSQRHGFPEHHKKGRMQMGNLQETMVIQGFLQMFKPTTQKK